MPEAILFEHANFHGRHKHVFGPEPNLNAGDDNFFNDRVSSIAILDGAWAFYRDSEFRTPYAPILGPGLYSVVTNFGIRNDDMSSLRPVGGIPAIHGAPIDGHVILFEHVNFHGAHKHVFTREPNLNASDDSFFNDRVSSIIVMSGVWKFYRDSGFQTPYPPTLGVRDDIDGFKPGLFPFVANVGISNDDMSSLQTAPGPASIPGPNGFPEGNVLLFEHINFHGQHKHVFWPEPNLNAGDDSFFNDRVSSLVVQRAVWAFYKNSGFDTQYPRTLGPGIYPWVEDYGIKNDDMSSLRPV